MGKVNEFFIQKKEEKDALRKINVVPNIDLVECPTCNSRDIIVGDFNSICLECNLVDDSRLFITKIISIK